MNFKNIVFLAAALCILSLGMTACQMTEPTPTATRTVKPVATVTAAPTATPMPTLEIIPDITDMLPDATDMLPDATDIIPEITDILPEVTDNVSDSAGGDITQNPSAT